MRLAETRHGEGTGAPLVIAHGLFGAGRNWASLARRLGRARPVVVVDMRNHGDSGWSEAAGYEAMAGDLAETVEAAGGSADLLGHSMGGKAAMALALTRPALVRRLIVADIAPIAYDHAHGEVVAAMRGLDLSRVARRADAEPMLAAAIPQAALRAFVLQNLEIADGRARWRPNLDALAAAMGEIASFPALPGARYGGPALFLRGGASDYVAPACEPAIRARFPAARIETLEGAGHWLHADRPEPFLAAVEAFLAA